MKRALLKLFSVAVILAMVLPSGAIAAPTRSLPQAAPVSNALAATVSMTPGEPPESWQPQGPTAPEEYWDNNPNPVARLSTALGDPDIQGAASMVVFNNELYIGTEDAAANTDGAEILGSSDGSTFTPERFGVTVAVGQRSAFYAMAQYGNYLYAALSCPACATPITIYRSQTGAEGSWVAIPSGSGGQPTFGAAIDTVRAMLVWQGDLWVFGSNEAGADARPEIQRYNGTSWTAENITFFDPGQRGIRSAAIFNGNLYVGTSFTGGNGCQVWRRVPGSGANLWTKMTEDGFGAVGIPPWWNVDVSAMYVYKNALYAGTYNPATGAELFRTYDGITWNRLFNAGLGEPNVAVRSMMEANGNLYLSMESVIGQARVFRTVDGEVWSPVTLPGLGYLTNTSANVLMVFQGSSGRHLYLGTQNVTAATAGDAQVWRVKLPTHEELWLQQVGILRGNASFDASVGPANNEARSFAEYSGALYVGVNNADAGGGFVYRTTDGQHWTQVGARGVDDAQSDPSGVVPANTIHAMLVMGSRLFIATGTTGGLARVFALNPDGNSWARIGPDDLGNANNLEATTLAAFNGQLWVGTANTLDPKGAQVCRFDAPDAANDTSTCNNETPNWANAENTRITAMEVFTPTSGTARLYIGTRRATGANLLYRTTSAWCVFASECPTTDGFNTTNPVISEISALKVFNDALYAGTRRQSPTFPVPGNQNPGGAVYRSTTGGQGAPANWSQVSRGGFSRDDTPDNTDGYNQAVTAFAIYRNYLYAGTEKPDCNVGGTGDCTDLGGEVWRTDGLALDYNQTNFPGYLRWDQVGAEGLGFFQNFRISALYTYKNLLYAGTFNDTPDKNGGPGFNFTGFTRTGGEVWRTDIPNQHVNDRCAEVVYVAVRVQAPAVLKVTSDAGNDVPRFLPRAGAYEVPLNYGPGVYQLRLEYADRSLFRNETIQVTTYADGRMDITHPTVTAPSIGAVKERFWDNRTTTGLVLAPTAETAIKTMEAYTDTSGGGSTKYLVVGTVDNTDGAAIYRSTGSSGFSTAPGFFAGLSSGVAEPNTRAVNDLLVYNSATVSNLMLAATRRNLFPARLYASTDLGNWTLAAGSPVSIRSDSWEALAFYSDGTAYNVWLAGNDTTNANRGEVYAVQVQTPSSFGWSARTPGNLDVRQNGFMSLLVFNNYLYAGTRTNTAGLGAQLWRYNGKWEMVAQGGIANPNNTAISAMAIHDGVLYVGTTNATGAELYASADGVNFERIWRGGLTATANDAVLSLHDSDGYLYVGLGSSAGAKSGEIHRSSNGRVWSPEIVQGFGVAAPQRNTNIPAMLAFDGNDGRFLYAGTARPAAVAPNGAQVWRTPLPPPLEEWEQVTYDGFTWGVLAVDSIVEQGEVLYVGVRPRGDVAANGARVYKTISGRHWTTVGLPHLVAEAFNNTEIDSLAIHNGTVYAGTRVPTGQGGRVYRLRSNGNEWERVGNVGGYVVGEAANTAITAMHDWNGTLYLGTENGTGAKLYKYNDSLDSFDQVPLGTFTVRNLIISSITSHGGYLFISTLNTGGGGETAGGEIWYSQDGATWASATSDGFASANNWWIPVLQSYTSTVGSHLYALTVNGVQGTQAWRSADGRSNWSQVNRPGFARTTGGTNPNNVVGYSAAAFDGYLYAGTATIASVGGEVYRTDGITDTSDASLLTLINWAQVNATGYGNPANIWTRPMLGHGDYLYGATWGSALGTQVWRARKTTKAIDADDSYLLGRVVGVGVRVTDTTTISVSPGGVTYTVPSLGTYEVVVTGTGRYDLTFSPGCSAAPVTIYYDTPAGATFDHLTFNTITDQTTNQAFPVTLQAWAYSGETTTIAITGTILLTDSTRTITPTSVVVTDTSSTVVNVTIGVSQTNVIITPTFEAKTGKASNPFTVSDFTRFSWGTISSPKVKGTPFAVVITAENALNGIVSGYNGTADLSASVIGGVITPTTTTFASGVASFNLTVGFTGTGIVVTATHPTIPSIVGVSNAFDVQAGAVGGTVYLPLVVR